MELVQIKNGEVMASSLDVAERFGKRHADVLEKISKILKQDSTENSVKCFFPTFYKDESGKENKMYLMNEKGFTFLAMGFTGKKADEWKWKYIEAFETMKQAILNQKNAEWIENRKQGKLARRAETDAIKEFVQYASENGSTHSDRYYLLFTKMVNGIVGAGNGRDFESFEVLQNLSVAEKAVTKLVRAEIEKGTEYHEIYKLCKERLVYLSECGLFEITQNRIAG